MRKRFSSSALLFLAILAVLALGKGFKDSARGMLMATTAPLLDWVRPEKEKQPANPNGVLAKVIYRTPSLWNSVLWVNVGEAKNREFEQPVVQINSPVVVGKAVVGVVDYVGEKQARVRLITDSAIAPAVRVARGDLQRQRKAEQIEALMQTLAADESLPEEAKVEVLSHLKVAKEYYAPKGAQWFLAKGEIRGSGLPYWKRGGDRLKGIGFNLEVADSLSIARDLRRGTPLDSNSHEAAVPLIQLHDLLITTGLDGVFPPGLEVGVVTKIELLKEGDYSYELEAVPAAGSLNELSMLTILPPIGYDPKDVPFSFLRKNATVR